MIYWEVDESSSLTTPVRNALQSRYGYTAPAEHTHAAIVSVRDVYRGETCLVTFATSFRAQDWTGNSAGLEAHIGAECTSRLTAIKNAMPLTSLLGRRHWL